MGDSEPTIPTPNSLLFHPEITWTEKLYCKICAFVLSGPLAATEIGSKESHEALTKFRDPATTENFRINSLKRWSQLYSPDSPSRGTLAESSGYIPFQKNILREWNIVDEASKLPDITAAANNREGVKVVVNFPSSLLADEIREKGTISERTECIEIDFDQIDWRNFAPEIPIILQFHGGAMVIGNAYDSLLVDEMTHIVQNASTKSSPALISMSIDYALAPDEPFPMAVMDALSVIDFLLKDNGARKSINVTGMSAGANIALVAGFEACRKFPGRISSIHAQSPFIDPAADSMSYYVEQNNLLEAKALRWGWQAYLGLKKLNDVPADDGSELEKVLRENSNYLSWKTWKLNYPSEGLHRLVNPVYGIPDDLNGDKVNHAPTIIVRYNRCDPLRDEGKAIINALKPKTGKNAFFYEERGLHCGCGFFDSYDRNNPSKFWKIWADAVIGTEGKIDSK